jgi:hypothetical protein
MNYPAASCEVSMKGKELNPDASIEEFSRLNNHDKKEVRLENVL